MDAYMYVLRRDDGTQGAEERRRIQGRTLIPGLCASWKSSRRFVRIVRDGKVVGVVLADNSRGTFRSFWSSRG